MQKSFLQGNRKIDVLRDINLSIEKGKTLAILGKSGSGKTTLLSILSGIEKSDAGSVIFNGEDITNYTQEQLTKVRSQSIGVIFQQFHLIEHLNALENVSLPLEILGDKNAVQTSLALLEAVGLSDRASHFPAQLSGGEKQRVAIARAMAIKPALLLADEPSGSLDEETGEKIMDLLFNLVRENDMSMILVTHETELAKKCDNTSSLELGILNQSDK
ncbi:ABC transporter ATP-binding protein [Halobacteriovorax sp. HLS]|uniref:ABC transporter ATP-binding protein n=1 Tax=Halobacteriovorax sp. HLS TaxID=2234000 RepID=UPI001F4E9717|nr:ABC transporter ATP-binding protein [Halobacteriovorax sp. HLS]